jgi:acetyl-CoA carboxylase biotin carboxyl carrier protein
MPAATPMPMGVPASLPQTAATDPAAAERETAAKALDGLVEIKSPIVGTFYRSSTPDADPYVTMGSDVSEDTVVCIIEAMKVMNEINAEVRGVIRKILVENASPVQFGQPLFLVEPR